MPTAASDNDSSHALSREILNKFDERVRWSSSKVARQKPPVALALNG